MLLLLFTAMNVKAQEGFECPCEGPGAINIDAGAGTNISQFLTQTTTFNSCMAIKGKLIINVTRTINGGEIRMQPGAEIILNGASRTLTLNNVNQNGGMHGCGQMWIGITVLGSSNKVTIDNSTVQDAQIALDVRPASPIQSIITIRNNALLDRNHIGVSVPNGMTLSGNASWPSLRIWGIRFDCSSNLLPPFDPALPEWETRSLVGITTQNFNFNIPEPYNAGGGTARVEFANLRTGIVAKGGAIELLRVDMQNMTYNGVVASGTEIKVVFSTFTDIPNCGIFLSGGRLVVTDSDFKLNVPLSSIFGPFYFTAANNFGIRTTDLTALHVLYSTFTGLQHGIYGTRTPATDFSNNRFDTEAGIFLYDILANQPIKIINNPEIKTKAYGIMIYPSSFDSPIDISNNLLKMEYPAYYAYTSGIDGFWDGNVSVGISLINLTPYSFDAGNNNQSISKNQIICGTLTPGIYSGIGVHGVNGMQITDNKADIGGSGFGILASHAPNILIKENTISGTLANASLHGIRITNDNVNTKVSCNHIYLARGTGILFATGDCSCIDENDPATCTEVKGNDIHLTNPATPNYEGLQVQYTMISPQTRTGNEWYGVSPSDPSTAVQDAYYWGDINIVGLSKFIIHTSNAPYYPGKIQVEGGVPGQWFGIESGSFYTCPDMLNDPPTGFDFGDYYDYVTGDEPSSEGDGLQWIFDRSLYRKLKNNPAFNNTSSLNAFFNAHATGTVGAFQLVDEAWLAAMKMPETTKQELVDKGELLAEKVADHALVTTDLEAAWPNEPQNLLDQLAVLNPEIEDIIEDMTTLQAAFLQQRTTALGQVLVQNGNITTGSYPEKYLQAVNNIRLENLMAGIPDFTANQRQDLELIAQQCLFDEGEAVSLARALLNLEVLDDCNNSSLAQPEAQTVTTADNKKVSVYPNPTTNEFWVYLPEITPGAQILLYNLSGTLVKRVGMSNSYSRIDITGLPAGLYGYRVVNAGQTISNGKLSIIR
ncbi:MAG: T9SS type A sorting domain-containing protein [Saprospiraceae bacterium]|nr:T9SS type A sorting domain-containing protein [Saprospiraceae bacterium]MDZ4704927.1 T9SS type A sorting domain-containing protein [Saprospiraceae bacterium]